MLFTKRQSAASYGLPALAGKAWRLLVLCGLLVCMGNRVFAQKSDSSDKIKINIDSTRVVIYTKTDSGEFRKFIGDVIIRQGTDTLYCDSAYQSMRTKNFEAFGDVRIAQAGGTQGTSDYLRYTTDKKLAFMSGNVSLTDGKNKLWCEELNYDLSTKTATYNKNGILYNDSTIVSSTSGVYNVKSKDARFTGNVSITDPQYKIKSEDILYNTETKVTRFFAKSVVTSDSGRSVLHTSNGTYDGKHGIARFYAHSSIWNGDQYIEGDSLRYDKLTGYGQADGHVICIDTSHHSTLLCGHAEYYGKSKVIWATIIPVLVQVNGKDTLHVRADTFYSAPMARSKTVPVSKTDSPVMHRQSDSTVTTGAIKQKFSTDTAAHDTAVKKIVMQLPLPEPAKDGVISDQTKEKIEADSLLHDHLFAGDTVKSTEPPVITIPLDTPVKKGVVKKGTVAGKTKAKSKIVLTATGKAMKGKVIATRDKGAKFEIPTGESDTTKADTSAPLYFIGYHHVRIFSDSLQGRCDSVCYTQSDSTIRMMYSPIAWSHKSQITGDTILMHLDSSTIKSMYVPDKAFMVSEAGPEKAELYDQIQGKTLTAWFQKSQVDSILVEPDAESIYYVKDDSGAYAGVDQSVSEVIRVYFSDQKIKKIKLVKEPHVTMTPMEQADLPNTRLSRFQWLEELRPKSKEELFR